MSDFGSEELIRRWPVSVARFLNRIICWTNMYCSGGCGYPVTGIFDVPIDTIDGVEVSMVVCSTESDCSRDAENLDVLDERGFRYSEVRPELAKMPPGADRYRLHFTR